MPRSINDMHISSPFHHFPLASGPNHPANSLWGPTTNGVGETERGSHHADVTSAPETHTQLIIAVAAVMEVGRGNRMSTITICMQSQHFFFCLASECARLLQASELCSEYMQHRNVHVCYRHACVCVCVHSVTSTSNTLTSTSFSHPVYSLLCACFRSSSN